ncbi:MAG: hypothetical protein MMC23_009136 [Stictis urceolatum]|nr:hypothetical protein [Stictis urceolata]
MPPKQTKGEYIETDTGNKVSRRSQIHGTTNIILGGRTVIQSEALIRGDLLRTLPPSQHPTSSSSQSTSQPQPQGAQLAVSIGKYSLLSTGSILHPPRKLHRGQFSHHPLKIGDNVHVGQGAIVEAASVGNNVWIGAGAVVGKLCILREGCRVLEGAVVPQGMVVGQNEVVGGRPARWVGDVGWGEGWDGRRVWRATG